MVKKINIVWLKKDLRLSDHLPLRKAFDHANPFICLYAFEPLVENNYDFDIRHWQFIYQSIQVMKDSIPISTFYGPIQDIFLELMEHYEIEFVFSHQETGNDVTFQRDVNLKKILKSHKIKWVEDQSNGVIRGLKNRKTWDAAWANYVNSKPIDIKINLERVLEVKNHFSLGDDFEKKLTQRKWSEAGHIQANKILNAFLDEKVENYFKNISFPDKARYHCSRLSAHLTYGNITIREIYQKCKDRRQQIKNKMSVDQFMARLKWHCHFIQKLEMQPSIEFKDLNPAFEHLRQKKNKKFIKAWKEGRTGYPLIDAGMRCVQETGYLNFRLRSCVVSFFTHHLWQPWQEGARHLARCFLDYEPGIHFSQFQMQAGTTGINTIRIYNPVKQSLEKDKEATFIKKWVPELKDLPIEMIHQPWLLTPMDEMMYGFRYGEDYPKRIVDHEAAAGEARDKLWQVKKSEQSKSHGIDILNRHTRRSKRTKAKRA